MISEQRVTLVHEVEHRADDGGDTQRTPGYAITHTKTQELRPAGHASSDRITAGEYRTGAIVRRPEGTSLDACAIQLCADIV